MSKYAHNRANLLKEGHQVNQGTVIAQVGNTGRSTGFHLHLELSKNGKPVDFLKVIAGV